ncbi:MAG: AAA family ATPase [Coleofasciculaceae cyanobacterium SM2_3_26]|nr:AAA family ATPase [Coleofasciculaceae cyanobacterium SM2_3_26]
MALRLKSSESRLAGSGWQPLYRQFDWDFLIHLAARDPLELTQKSVDLFSHLADALGRKEYTWWANLFYLFSKNIRYEVDEFWDYITPRPPAPDYGCRDMLSIETPVVQAVNRSSIPINYVLNRVREIAIFKILDLLGSPDIITQSYQERHFYYPATKFVNWERLEVVETAYACWVKPQTWLQIDAYERGRRCYTLISPDLSSLVNKATYNLAVMLSGYQCRIGKIHSQFAIHSFPSEIQRFTDRVQQEILKSDRLVVLVYGEPGTGKTAWTQAVAAEILKPLGYAIFILDYDAVENFVPPAFLERICLILNEADNLAPDRNSEVAQQSTRTEHILGLLDGTLHQSVIEADGIQTQQKFVALLTCNTTERLDPAMMRKGRVDMTCEFSHRFV